VPRRNKLNCFQPGSNLDWQPTVYTLFVINSVGPRTDAGENRGGFLPKKLPLGLSQLIAYRLYGMAPAEGAGGGGAGGLRGYGGGGGGEGNLQAMIDGDAVIVSSTVEANADQAIAITVWAGVEAILTKSGSREMSLGGWNMGGGGDLGGSGQ
jgi:hypothetical protein